MQSPPPRVGPLLDGEFKAEDYRSSPFIIQAACRPDNLEVFQELHSSGCSLTETGHICLSPKRGNSVISNIVGAASYHGSVEILQYVLRQVDSVYVNVKTQEN
jgi:hypothetical protein